MDNYAQGGPEGMGEWRVLSVKELSLLLEGLAVPHVLLVFYVFGLWEAFPTDPPASVQPLSSLVVTSPAVSRTGKGRKEEILK